MKVLRLRGRELQNYFISASQLLTAKKEEINILNVFPVPDGDTGTNMALTLAAAVKQAALFPEDSVTKVAKELAQGALMGARGNSGVILSQLIRGFALSLAGKDTIEARDLAQALQAGVDTAYQGVKKPVEGTILTVARLGAQGAVTAAKVATSFEQVLTAACLSAQAALENTPNLLPILKQVGVVDAGGMGWLVILQGFLLASQGKAVEADSVEPVITKSALFPISSEIINFQYCTEFLVKGTGLNQNQLYAALEPLGDSLLVVGDANQLKIHVHSNQPGQVLELCLLQGSLHEVHISNMLEQLQQNQPHQAMQLPNPDLAKLKPLGLVAVATGAGLHHILTSLGVDQVVEGGQTSNPSTEALVKAIEAVPAKQVLLLPNNSNILLAAQQARELVQKSVEVIPTKSIPQGIAALVAYDPEADLETNLLKMGTALMAVVTIEVTSAVRDSVWGDKQIKQADILGLIDNQLAEVGQDLHTVVLQTLHRVLRPEHGMVTIFYGEEVAAEKAEALQVELSTQYPEVDFDLQLGGQPLYYYIIAVE